MSSKFILLLFLLTSTAHSSMRFDGVDDFVNVIPIDLQSYNQFTLSAWIMVDAGATTEDCGIIAEYFTAPDNTVQYEIGLDMDQGIGLGQSRLAVGFYDSIAWRIVRESQSIDTGVWIHVAGTFDGTTLRLYKNGVETGNLVPGVPLPGTVTATYIGRRHDVVDKLYFPGFIDDARIYSRALSANEVTSLALSRSRLLITDGLVGWWKLDDGNPEALADGAVAKDSSGHGNTGTPTSGPIWKGSILSYP